MNDTNRLIGFNDGLDRYKGEKDGLYLVSPSMGQQACYNDPWILRFMFLCSHGIGKNIMLKMNKTIVERGWKTETQMNHRYVRKPFVNSEQE